MLYDVVLNNGIVLQGFTTESDVEEVLKAYLKDDVFVIQENKYPTMTTYISKDKVSHIRFSKEDGKTLPL